MGSADHEPHPLPDDPALARAAAALRDTEHWAWVVDGRWRLVYMTDAFRLSFGALRELVPTALGLHTFGPRALAISRGWRFGPNSSERLGSLLRGMGGWVLADTPGGVEELRGLVDPSLHGIVDELTPSYDEVLSFVAAGFALDAAVAVPTIAFRIRRPDGELAGSAMVAKPAPSMTTLSAMTSIGDLDHFRRMMQVSTPARRPAAVLFADLEASSPLARRLSTASYFALDRRLVRAADRCVVDAGGLVGRHVGDGVTAFFLAETAGSESAAARACISAARALREAVGEVASRSDLPDDIVLRFGLHWGSTVYVGSIATSGRFEVTALGDAVNEAARIEACASGGRALASKELIERLGPDDASALALDPDRIGYEQLGQLETATEKARRDAPAIAVCDV